jgi:hypothetical protein
MTWQSFIDAERARGIGTFEIEQDVKLLIWPARYLLPFSCALMTLTLAIKLLLSLARGPQQNPREPFI